MSRFLSARRGSNSSNEGDGGGPWLKGGDAAARKMYRSFVAKNPRMGGESGLRAAARLVEDDENITKDQLLEQVMQMTEREQEMAETAALLDDDEEGERLFVDALMEEESTEEAEREDGNEEDKKKKKKKLPKRLRKAAKQKIDSFIEFVLAKINQQWVHIAYAVFPFQQVQTLILVCLVQFISLQAILHVLPMLIAYGAFIAMAYMTLKMFHNKNAKKEKEIKRRLLHLFGEENTDRQPYESLFLTENWDPYLNFVLALFVFVLAIGAAGKYLPYCSLLCAVSAGFSLITFFALADRLDHFAIYAVVANFISCLPTIFSRMRLPIGYWKVWKPVMEFRFAYFTLSLSLCSIAWLSIPVAYAMMAYRQSTWTERAQLIVPHLICIVWADIAMTMWMIGWQSFTYIDGLLTASAAILFFLPSSYSMTIGIVFAGALLAQIRPFVQWLSVAKALVTLCVLASPFIFAKLYGYVAKLYKVQVFPEDSKKRRWVLAMAYLLALLMAVSFLYQGQFQFDPCVDVSNMTWMQFEKHCAPRSANQISSQIDCSQLKGTAVQWKGSVQSIRITGIENAFESLLGYVPESLGQTIRCFYDNNSTLISHPSGMRPNQCSLTAHNVYSFEVELSGPYGERVVSSSKGLLHVSATHAFTEMLKLLDEGDIVQFVALFDNYPIFRYPPRLKLVQLECIHCNKFQKNRHSHLRVTSSKMDRTGVWSRIFNAFKFFFHFVFAPFIRIR